MTTILQANPPLLPARCSAARSKIINDIIRRDDDPPIYKRAYPKWLHSLSDLELGEYYELVRFYHPDKPQNEKS